MMIQAPEEAPRSRHPRLRAAAKAATVLATFGFGAADPAYADVTDSDSKDSKKTVIEKKAESRIKFYGLIEAGVTFNETRPGDNQNFGRLFDDRDSEPLLNQATYTVERALAPEEGKFDYGFKLQVTAGTDARYLNPIGELDRLYNGRYTAAVVEAYGNLHFPVPGTAGGLDLKLGQFASPQSAETIYPTGNFFYSKSFIFNFGVPLQHLGAVAQLHATKFLDLYGGVVRGTNVGLDDNNDVLSGIGGFQLTLLEGKLIVAGNTSIGAENDAVFNGVNVRSDGSIGRINTNGDLRYYNNLNVTIKPNDKLTLITDLVYSRDDGFRAEAYGAAQYVQYAFNKYVSLGLRGEIFRDDDGFFVAQFGADDDFADLTRGELRNIDRRTVGGGGTTYAAATLGVNVKPIETIIVRPELRFDKALDGHKAFTDSSKSRQFTAALDVIFTF